MHGVYLAQSFCSTVDNSKRSIWRGLVLSAFVLGCLASAAQGQSKKNVLMIIEIGSLTLLQRS